MGSGLSDGSTARLLAIVTTAGRTYRHAELSRALRSQTRRADLVVVECESASDLRSAAARSWGGRITVVKHRPTPVQNGQYMVIPYAHKINDALDLVAANADASVTWYVVYVTDDSLPHPEKFERMLHACETLPAAVVWCRQRRVDGTVMPQIEGPINDAYCILDHTQVMHRLTQDRWDLDGDVRLGDARFWRKLHASLGAFYPVPYAEPLDTIVRDPGELGITQTGMRVIDAVG